MHRNHTLQDSATAAGSLGGIQQKNTDNTTQESTAEDDLTAADPDEDGEELDPEFSQDVEQQ